MGIRGALFSDISEKFTKAALAGAIPRCDANAVLAVYDDEGIASVDRHLLSCFYDFALPYLPEDTVGKFRSLRKLSDLRFPSEWFPEARQMQRKIIMHVGPTNSGKTYQALQRLSEAQSGIYCGPLRLLAHEIYERMNAKGVGCNLLTGEEKREVSPYAPLTSSTIEMANLGRPMEVAVIDEIQMIADPNRGWAWTQALLGLKAKEIHLCGEPSVVPLIKRICESLSEEVVVNEYDRLTPVNVVEKSLNRDWSNIQKGDCVIAFSRTDIFKIKKVIEEETNFKCAVAYGALPPETRALQAKVFNDPDSGVDVLVASDAVGMGLNLNIKRVVFSTVTKFDGKNDRYISTPQLKQIGGRAGRFGTAYASGEVTTMKQADLSYVQHCMNAPVVPITMAGLQPTVDILELFAHQLPDEPFSALLAKFEDIASVDGSYFLCNYEDQKKIADTIQEIPLEIRDRYQFVTAPVNSRKQQGLDTIKHLAKVFSEGGRCKLEELVDIPQAAPTGLAGLNKLEMSHKQIILYMWLSLRYPDVYVTSQDDAIEIKTRCEQLIDEGLRSTDVKEQKKRKKAKKRKSSVADRKAEKLEVHV
ncbi:hypothetical protein EC973_004866 [Apophysomyces ossiformis]|uniref:RNA helicase n=1 Tax=Apophysomyces ossiformis TaxID=679940 RepID=A0A8H7BPN1_9FUNG|nr:hypothetical protein EC973_004866 [Apophysomyces ossiformis]